MNPLSPHHLVKYRAERILAVEAYLERGGRAPECVGRPIDERHELEQKTCLHRPFEGRISPGRRARWHSSGKEYGDSRRPRSEEHTSELQSLMRISYAVFCLTKKHNKQQYIYIQHT